MAEYISLNQKKLLQVYNKYGNVETVEDLLSKISIRLLQEPEGKIDNPRGFLKVAVINEAANYRTVNRKYMLSDDWISFFGNYEQKSLMDMERTFKELYRNIELLPLEQKNAIMNRLNETHDKQSNTEKANYRHGIKNLQSMLKIKRTILEEF